MKILKKPITCFLIFLTLFSTFTFLQFNFVTKVYASETTDYVDGTSDVDAVADVGTHSSFASQQAKDLVNDTLTEALHASPDVQDFVDSNTTDVDSSPNIGLQSNFTAQKYKDLINDTLTEVNTGGTGTPASEYLNCNANGSTYTQWTVSGTAPYVDTANLHNITATTANYCQGWFDYPSTTITGTLIVNVTVLSKNVDGTDNDYAAIFADWTGGAGSEVADTNSGTSWLNETTSLSALGCDTVTEVNALRFYVKYRAVLTAHSVWVDMIRVGVSNSSDANYQLQVECAFTSIANYSMANEYLDIFCGTLAAESLNVEVWTGSAWFSAGVLISNSWKNISVATWLTSATLYVRFRDATITGDTTASTWYVDCALLHMYENNYALELEEQFSSVSFGDTIEEVCVFTGTNSTSENLKLQCWTGSAWYDLSAALTMNAWNNISVSTYLTSANFYIRFADGTHASDTVSSTWTVDAVLLHTYNDTVVPVFGSIIGSFAVAITSLFSTFTYSSLTESFGLVGSSGLSWGIGSKVTATFSALNSVGLTVSRLGAVTEAFVVASSKLLSGLYHSSLAESFGITSSHDLGWGVRGRVAATISMLYSIGQTFSRIGTVVESFGATSSKALSGLYYSSLAESFALDRNSQWTFTPSGIIQLYASVTSWASGLLIPLHFYGDLAASLAIIGRSTTLFTHFGLASPSFTVASLPSNLFQRLGSVAESFSVLASRAESVLRSSTVAASFAVSGLHGLLSFTRFPTIAESFAVGESPSWGFTHYGVVAESFGAFSSRASTFLRSSVEAISFAVSGGRVLGRGFGGSVAESFSALGARATALSRSLSTAAVFVIRGLDGMVFQRFGVAPLSLTLNSLKAVSAATAGAVVASFSVASSRLDSLLRFGSASLSTALSGQRSLLESVGGAVAEAFDVGTLRSWTVLKQALVPLTTTLSSVASGLYGAIITLYSSIPLTFTSVSSRVLSIIRQGNVAEALAINTINTLAFLKGGLASLGASVSNTLSFVQNIGGSVLEAFTIGSSRLVTLLGLGSVSESFTVGASRYWSVLRFGLTQLTTSLSSLAEGLFRTLNLYGLVPESFVTEAGKIMEMFTLGSVTQALGALGLKAMTLLKTSETTVAFAITKLMGGLPTLLTFFGSILQSFDILSIGSSFMLPYAHVGGDYFIVGVAAGLLCAMIAMASISQRLRRTRRRL